MTDLSQPLSAPDLAHAQPAPWLLGAAEPCVVLGLNGQGSSARLVGFQPVQGVALFVVPPARSSLPLRFAQFQRLMLSEPLRLSGVGGAGAPSFGVPDAKASTGFQMWMSNGSLQAGRTVGHVEAEHGLFLFPPFDDTGRVQRVFFPRHAYRGVDFEHAGFSQPSLNPAPGHEASVARRRLRNELLGRMLSRLQLIADTQLEQMLELLMRTPALRLTEALFALDNPGLETLASRLRHQPAGGLSAGEILVNHGLLTAEELQQALDTTRGRQVAPLSSQDPPSLVDLPPILMLTETSPTQESSINFPEIVLQDLPDVPAALPDAASPASLGLLGEDIAYPDQLAAALEAQARMPPVRIGDALVALGHITEAQLAEALSRQGGSEGAIPLGEVLVRNHLITRANLRAAFARKMGYPQVNVRAYPIDVEALRKLSVAAALRLKMLPLAMLNGKLVVATDDPLRQDRLEEADFITQCKVVPVLASVADLAGQIPLLYSRLGLDEAIGDAVSQRSKAEGTDTLLAALELPADNAGGAGADDNEGAVEQSDSSLVRLINSMIVEAHSQGVSDIHIETRPGREKVKVRFRVDGLLRPYLELPHTYRQALVARLKIMCDLDISERRRPQDGKINFARFVPQCPIELRVAMIPTANGLEDAVLRILASAKPLPLDSLGMSPHNLKELKKAVERPYGMVLCVGPTGSGKTTTLHSALSFINTPERKIWTAEDPVEITQAGLRQVQVNPKIDWTFAKALRAFLRADPDVIMVGEIRDNETAQIAVESSLTGHLVLSTLHTNSAPETITRLLDMGMDPFNFADALLGVLAQRLVRRICSGCKTATPATPEQVEELVNDNLHVWGEHAQAPTRDDLLADWTKRFAVDGRLMFYKGTGCAKCGNTGVKGRAGVHELLTVSKGVRHLIQQGARAEQIQQHAMGEGMRTLRQDGIEKVLAGVTTIEEVRATSNS